MEDSIGNPGIKALGDDVIKSLFVVEFDVDPDEIVESSFGIAIVLDGKG